MSWFKTPDTLFEEKRTAKKNLVNSTYKAYSKEPVMVNGIIWNGGDSSAAAIKGAIDLAQQNGETVVSLWDINDSLHDNISFEDALGIAKMIATQYRDRMFARSHKLAEVEAATTQAELDAIVLPSIGEA